MYQFRLLHIVQMYFNLVCNEAVVARISECHCIESMPLFFKFCFIES